MMVTPPLASGVAPGNGLSSPQNGLVPPADNATASVSVNAPNLRLGESRQTALEALWTFSNRPRQRHCRRVPNGASDGSVAVHRSESGTYFTGLQTCGHISCPVCGPKIRRAERERVSHIVESHLASGGSVYLFLLSVSHGPHDGLSDLLDAMDAGRSVAIGGKGGSRWAKDRRDHGIVGTAWYREEVKGRNGWHPHYHGLLFTEGELSDDELLLLQERIYGRYREGLATKGRWARRVANSLQPVRSVESLADYVTKQDAVAASIAAEMTRGDVKTSKGTTPGAMLERFAATGDDAHLQDFLDYEAACEGRRWRYLSPALTALYGAADATAEADVEGAEAEDLADAAEAIGGVRVFSIPGTAWKVLTRTLGAVQRLRALVHADRIDAALAMVHAAEREAYRRAADRPGRPNGAVALRQN